MGFMDGVNDFLNDRENETDTKAGQNFCLKYTMKHIAEITVDPTATPCVNFKARIDLLSRSINPVFGSCSTCPDKITKTHSITCDGHSTGEIGPDRDWKDAIDEDLDELIDLRNSVCDLCEAMEDIYGSIDGCSPSQKKITLTLTRTTNYSGCFATRKKAEDYLRLARRVAEPFTGIDAPFDFGPTPGTDTENLDRERPLKQFVCCLCGLLRAFNVEVPSQGRDLVREDLLSDLMERFPELYAQCMMEVKQWYSWAILLDDDNPNYIDFNASNAEKEAWIRNQFLRCFIRKVSPFLNPEWNRPELVVFCLDYDGPRDR